MDDVGELWNVWGPISVVLWIGCTAGLAVAAFVRFRATAAGLLMGTGLAVMGFKALAINLIRWLAVADLTFGTPAGRFVFLASQSTTFVLYLAIAAGVLCIPSSLKVLARDRARPAETRYNSLP